MANSSEQIHSMLDREYELGFVTDIDVVTFEPGLNEEIIKRLSSIKGEPDFLLLMAPESLPPLVDHA